MLYRYRKFPYRYRYDPVPGVHVRRSRLERHAKLGSAIRATLHEDYRTYNRMKPAIDLEYYIYSWDGPRDNKSNRVSWKDKKMKHQWEKHM